MTSFDPYQQEDEGYVAASDGAMLSANPYPPGTIRYEEWRRGWHLRRDGKQHQGNEGYQAAAQALRLEDNPHPPGTIRYDEWRRGWNFKQDEDRRTVRLGGRI